MYTKLIKKDHPSRGDGGQLSEPVKAEPRFLSEKLIDTLTWCATRCTGPAVKYLDLVMTLVDE